MSSMWLTDFKRIVHENQFVIFDTETTGLHDSAEIVQIAVIDHMGSTLLDTLVKPTIPISEDATDIHGITNEMVADAPMWASIAPKLENIFTSVPHIISYNIAYDMRMLNQSSREARINSRWVTQHQQYWCAMEAFAEIFGDWNSYRQSYRWQKLATAANYYDLPVLNAHSALGDALMTLGVCKGIATTVPA